MDTLSELLCQTFFIQPENVSTLASKFKPEFLSKGDSYLKEGHYCEKMSFIKTGMIRIYKQVGDKEVTQWISTPRYFVTELSSLIFDQPSRFSMEALTDCEIYSISKDDYLGLKDDIPEWPDLERRFLSACFVTIENRVFSQLSQTAEERYNALMDQSPELFNQVPLKYIASMLGMTPETLSRLRAKN